MKQELGKPFRAAQGKFRTSSLFKETLLPTVPLPPVFTLQDEDTEDEWSMHRLYMECEDVSEYEFARTIVGSWKAWQILLACKWFKPYIKSWREELRAKLESKAIEDIRNISKGTTAAAFTAAKWLAEKQYDSTAGATARKKAGRPKKEAEDNSTQEQRDVNKDFERLKLVK